MHTFRVWAPLPKEVQVQVGQQRFPMMASQDGWWQAEVPASAGDDYGFVLDGDGPFPDPRSPWQPNGVKGLSRLVGDDRFAWSDAHFQSPPFATALIYELHVGTFTPEGTFLSVIGKLPHLRALGVTHVELMPVGEFPGHHGWGYDGVDLFAPHHAYGVPNDLKQLVDACHAAGLAVILDVVYNHLGPSGNYLGRYGPYFTNKFATFWGQGINYDGPDSGEVRRFFCDNALYWLGKFHFDGLRLDAVHGILDTSAVHILEQLKLEVEALAARTGRDLVLIPESDLNDPRLLWPRARGGYQLDAQWSDDFHHALHAVLTGETSGYYADFGTVAQLAKALQCAFVYDGNFSPHRRRVHGRPAAGLSGGRFLAYLQNHDQIGNRARGDRSGQLMTLGRLKAGAALVLTSPFTPMLFQGEEWAASTPFCYFTDYGEPELAQAVREGRRREFATFGWKPEDIADPQAPESVLRSVLNWSELDRAPYSDMLAWHQQLVRLRRSEPSLSDGDLKAVQVRFDEARRWLTVERGSITVACNFFADSQAVPAPAGEQRLLLASENDVQLTSHAASLPPDSVAILKRAG